MEFVNPESIQDVLNEHGIESEQLSSEQVRLQMADAESVVHLHLSSADCEAESRDGAERVETPAEQLPEVVENIIHRLHLNQILLIPISRWREVFDCVAFSLADNEAWQEIDATATIELNSRDPLLCEPGDYHTLMALIRALYTDGEMEQQGLMLTTTAAPLLMEVVPTGALRISMGNPALADEVRDTVEA